MLIVVLLSFSAEQVLASSFGNTRVILHCDLDCFYAQVEEQLHPEHKGKPLGVYFFFILLQ